MANTTEKDKAWAEAKKRCRKYPGYSNGKAVGDVTKITSEKYPFPKRTMEAAGKAMDS